MWGFFVKQAADMMESGTPNGVIDGACANTSQVADIQEHHSGYGRASSQPTDTPSDPLHARLQQKVLELRTGKAFVNQQSWFGKIHGWWNQLVPRKIQLLIDDSLPFLWLAGVVFTCLPLMAIQSLFSFGATLMLVELGVVFLVVQLNHHTGGHNERTSKNLGYILQHEPFYEPIVREIFSHFDNPNVLRAWWNDVNEILEKISDSIASQPNPTQPKLHLRKNLKRCCLPNQSATTMTWSSLNQSRRNMHAMRWARAPSKSDPFLRIL